MIGSCGVSAGPVAWVAIALALSVQPNPAWVLADPLRALSLGVAWPLLEEALFRGVIQRPSFAHAGAPARRGA